VVAADEPALTTMKIEPITAEPGESQVINVEVDCAVSGCSAIDIVLGFDPTILQVDELVTGPSFGEDVYFLENYIDNTNGILRLAATSMGDPSLTNDTTLLQIHVTMLKAGTTALTVHHVDLGDLEGNPIEVEPQFAPIEVIGSTCEYKIQFGDTLLGIAIGNQVTVDDLITLNNIENPGVIIAGTTLIVPAAECQAAVGGRTNVVDVHSCRHVGNNVFEWYSVRVEYDSSGNPVHETRVGGPFTGAWQPGCPEGERPQRPSSGGGHSGSGGSHDPEEPNPDPPDLPGCWPQFCDDYDDSGGVFYP
jgi:LysM repeat protein